MPKHDLNPSTDLSRADLDRIPELLKNADAYFSRSFQLEHGVAHIFDGHFARIKGKVGLDEATIIIEFHPARSENQRHELFAFDQHGKLILHSATEMKRGEQRREATAPYARDGLAIFRACSDENALVPA